MWYNQIWSCSAILTHPKMKSITLQRKWSGKKQWSDFAFDIRSGNHQNYLGEKKRQFNSIIPWDTLLCFERFIYDRQKHLWIWFSKNMLVRSIPQEDLHDIDPIMISTFLQSSYSSTRQDIVKTWISIFCISRWTCTFGTRNRIDLHLVNTNYVYRRRKSFHLSFMMIYFQLQDDKQSPWWLSEITTIILINIWKYRWMMINRFYTNSTQKHWYKSLNLEILIRKTLLDDTIHILYIIFECNNFKW